MEYEISKTEIKTVLLLLSLQINLYPVLDYDIIKTLVRKKRLLIVLENETIKIIGAGNCGISILEHLVKLLESKNMAGKNLVLIRYDVEKGRLHLNCLKREKYEKRPDTKDDLIFLNNYFAYGLGTLANQEHANMIYFDENKKAIIDSMVGESKRTIICGGLGGGFGSVFISNFSSENKDVYSYVLSPANYESENRKKNAKHALTKMGNSVAQFRLWDMEDILMKNFNY